MSDLWEQAAQEFKKGQPQTAPGSVSKTAAPNEDWKLWAQTNSPAQGSGTPASQPSAVGDFASGLWQNVNPMPALKLAAKTAAVGAGAATPQQEQEVRNELYQGFVQPSINQFQKAKQAWQQPGIGSKVEAAGHALAGAIPVVGPAAAQAGEDIGEGRTAKGLGEATGLLAPFGVAAAAQHAAPLIRESAETSYAQALRPTGTANKALVQNKLAPGMADRRITALTQRGLQNKAAAGEEAAAEQIDAAEPSTANLRVQLQPILDNIEAKKSQFLVQGKPANAAAQASIQQLEQAKQDLAKYGPEMSYEDLRAYRQILDKQVQQVKGGFALPPDVGSQISATRNAANAVRGELASASPDMAKAFKEWSFWKSLNDIQEATKTRTQGQTSGGLTARLGSHVGAAAMIAGGHGITGAIEAAAIFRGIQRLADSTAWKTVSGATKASLADKLAAGDLAGAGTIVGALSGNIQRQQPSQEPQIPVPMMALGGIVVPKSGKWAHKAKKLAQKTARSNSIIPVPR